MFRKKKIKETKIDLEKDRKDLKELKYQIDKDDKGTRDVMGWVSATGVFISIVGIPFALICATAAVVAVGGALIGAALIIGGAFLLINALELKDFETEVLNKSKKQKQLMIPLTKMNDYFKNIIKERGKETDAFRKTTDADGKEITYEKNDFRAEGKYKYDKTNRQYIFSDRIEGKEKQIYTIVSIREGEVLILYDKKTNTTIFKWFNDKDGIPMFYFKDGIIFVCSGEHNKVKRFTFDIETFKAEEEVHKHTKKRTINKFTITIPQEWFDAELPKATKTIEDVMMKAIKAFQKAGKGAKNTRKLSIFGKNYKKLTNQKAVADITKQLGKKKKYIPAYDPFPFATQIRRREHNLYKKLRY